MKILAISTYYKPIKPGYGTRTPEIIIDSSAKLGNDVTVITGIVPSDMISDSKFSKLDHTETIGNGTVRTKRVWIPTSGHHKPLRRSLIYMMFVWSCFFKMLFSRDYDIVLGLFPFPPFLIPLELLAKLKRKKFYLHQGDLFPDTVIDFQIIKNPFFIKFLKKISIFSFNLADIIGVNNLATKKGMQKYVTEKNKLKYLELAVDTEIFTTLNKKNTSRFSILYNGVFGPAYDFNLILDAAKKLEQYDINFIIAGQGELESNIKTGIDKRKLTNVQVKSPVKKMSDLVSRINNSDLTLLPLISSNVSKTPHPSKIFEYMACGKPVICAGAGAIEDIFSRSEAGIIVPSGDLEKFTKSILHLYHNRDILDKMGINARKYAVENHSMDVYMKNFNKILNSLS
jgi:glycosyltransferase involved in cell wall biosynthesis